MMIELTSFKNPKIKSVIALRDRSERNEKQLTLIEGLREVERAISAGVVVTELYVCRDSFKGNLTKLSKGCDQIYECSKEIFEKISYGERNEGILVVATIPSHELKALKLKNEALVLVLEDIEKPGNLGAILRSADGAGVDAVIVTDPKTDLYNPNVIRASLGTIFTVKTCCATNAEVLEFLNKNKIKLLATSPDASKLYSDVDCKSSTAFILGSEDKGLSEFWMKNADVKIKIPMKGIADSLNVSVSSAVLLYEALRQRENIWGQTSTSKKPDKFEV